MRMRLFPALALLLAVGCDAKTDGDDAGEGVSDGDGDGDDGTMLRRCEIETRDDEFKLGLVKSGASMQLTFTDATPAMPTRGDNDWTIEISDLQGTAMDDMDIGIIPWMPDHGHGTPVPVEITSEGDGLYNLAPVNLFMAGYWEITFELTTPDDQTDEVVVAVCVE